MGGGIMSSIRSWLALAVLSAFAASAGAQTFRVQCPGSTTMHPAGANGAPNPDIKCQQISGGDGFATMADGTQTYLFAFGPLSCLRDIYNGLPGTQNVTTFNTVGPVGVGTPSTLVGMPDGNLSFNGAIGLTPDPSIADDPACAATPRPSYCATGLDGHVDTRPIMDVGVMNGSEPAPLMAIDEDDEFFLTLTNVGQIMRPDLFQQHTVHFHGYPNASAYYDGVPDASVAINIGGSFTYYYLAPDAGTYFWPCHITPPEHLQMGMVGQLYVRPRQDRVPVGTALYTALEWQNGLVEPAVPGGTASRAPDPRTACNPAADILCSAYTPAVNTGATQKVDPLVIDPKTGTADLPYKYVYNDGDGSTAYDTEYPMQMHGFDPNFHYVGMTFNPEMFVDMNDKYFLLNGRSYPDTVGACGGVITGCTPGPQATTSSDTQMHYSQPLPALIN